MVVIRCYFLITHSIHIWFIYLRLVDVYDKCRQINHTWMLFHNYHGAMVIKNLHVVPLVPAGALTLGGAWLTFHNVGKDKRRQQ